MVEILLDKNRTLDFRTKYYHTINRLLRSKVSGVYGPE